MGVYHDLRLARRLREDPEFRAEFERQQLMEAALKVTKAVWKNEEIAPSAEGGFRDGWRQRGVLEAKVEADLQEALGVIEAMEDWLEVPDYVRFSDSEKARKAKEHGRQVLRKHRPVSDA